MHTRPACLAPALALVLAVGAPVSAQQAVEHNGILYQVEKNPATGEPLYHHAGLTFTHEQLRAHIAAQKPQILTPYAQAAVAAAQPHQMLDLVIVLRNQPAAPIGRAVWAQVKPQSEQVAEQIRAISRRPMALAPSMNPQQERAFVPPALTPAELEARRQLSLIHDDLIRDARREIYRQIEAAVAPEQDAMAAAVQALGGAIIARVPISNTLGISIPAAQVARLTGDPRIARIDIDHPGEPELNNSALAMGVTTSFWANNSAGGAADAGVLDTGVQMNHPALTTHPFLSNMGANDSGTHGTHVAGIMVSTDAVHRGMAWGADKIIFALAGSITTSMPGMNYIASTGEPEACNYSFGNGTANTSDYTPTDQFFDGVISTFDYMVSKSTGNGGFGSGNPTITHPAPAYNLMACASMDDFNTPTRADDRISSFSSRGPTVGGRKKPDITAPGSNILSCNKNWASGAHFVSNSGTSMAAPHVGGSILLLYDLGVTNVTAGKAILINTADAINDNNTSGTGDDQWVQGSLWNRRYGWGYMNLASAYLHGLDYFVDTVASPPGTGTDTYRLYAGQMFTNEKATLAWKRHVAYNGSTYPTQIESLSDLDLFAYNAGTGQQVASSVSAIDNVEQLHAPADGMVVLKVKAMAPFDPQVPIEEFALATQENFSARTGPAFQAAFVSPPTIAPSEQFQLTVHVTNNGDLAAHGVLVNLTGITIISGPNPMNIGAIDAQATAPAVWTVQAAAATGSHNISVSISSPSYGETFTGDGQGFYQVGGCYANCDGSTTEPILTVADFSCFLTKFAAGDPYANCDQSTVAPVLNVADFTCFLTRFAAGCE
jgi:serine protease AprX